MRQLMTEDDFDSRVQALLANPEDEAAALRLESAAQEGGDPKRVADAFRHASDTAPRGVSMHSPEKTGKTFCFRAARTYESAHEKKERGSGLREHRGARSER